MKYDFCEELKECYKDNVFDNDTIIYYLNGFMDALNIPMEKGQIVFNGFHEIREPITRKEYISDRFSKIINNNSHVDISKNKSKKGEWIQIYCQANNDLKAKLNVYYKRGKLKNDDINVLPFSVTINVKYDNYLYKLHAECKDFFTAFNITKLSNDLNIDGFVDFCVERSDFENVLKVIMHFVNNPDLVMKGYKHIFNKHGMLFQSAYIDIFDEVMLDKHGKRYEKTLK